MQVIKRMAKSKAKQRLEALSNWKVSSYTHLHSCLRHLGAHFLLPDPNNWTQAETSDVVLPAESYPPAEYTLISGMHKRDVLFQNRRYMGHEGARRLQLGRKRINVCVCVMQKKQLMKLFSAAVVSPFTLHLPISLKPVRKQIMILQLDTNENKQKDPHLNLPFAAVSFF